MGNSPAAWLLAGGNNKEEAGFIKRENEDAKRESAKGPVNELKVGPRPPPIMRPESEVDGIASRGLMDPMRFIADKGSAAVGVLPLRLLSS
jgi:hypothetical protein